MMLGRCRASRSAATAAIALTVAVALTPARPAAGQSASYIGNEVFNRLTSQHAGKPTWSFSNTSALPSVWLIQSPPESH